MLNANDFHFSSFIFLFQMRQFNIFWAASVPPKLPFYKVRMPHLWLITAPQKMLNPYFGWKNEDGKAKLDDKTPSSISISRFFPNVVLSRKMTEWRPWNSGEKLMKMIVLQICKCVYSKDNVIFLPYWLIIWKLILYLRKIKFAERETWKKET